MARSPRTHAAPALKLLQGQAQMTFLWALLYPDRYWLHMVYMISICLGRALYTVGLSDQCLWSLSLGCLRSTYDLCPSHPDGCTQHISIPLENIHPLILTCISSSLDIHHPYFCAYWKCKKKKKKTESEREREIEYFLYSSFFHLGIIFPSVHSVCSHWEQKTNKIIPKISEQQISSGLLWNQNWQVMDTCNSTHINVTEATTNNVLVSLTLPRQAR